MAGSVAGIIGWGVSDAEVLSAVPTRWSTVSRFDACGGSSPLASRGGIVPTGGTPLAVTAQGTPARSVLLKAGSCFVPGNSLAVPGFGLTLDTDTTLATDAEHATLPRIDLVIAKVLSDGTTSSAGTFEILTGTAAASPVRPTLPSGNNHVLVLKTINVQPATVRSVITAADVVTVQSDSWSQATSDVAGYFAAPGGTVLFDGVMGLSVTRRQAWAALYAPGTRWVDTVARCEGYIAGGDIVPTSQRQLTHVQNLGIVSTGSTSPVTAVSAVIPASSVIGGSRRIQLHITGWVTTDGVDGQWLSGRVYVGGSGLNISNANYSQHQVRIESSTASPSQLSKQSVNLSYYGFTSTGFTANVDLLREGGSAPNIYMTKAEMTVIDLGPA